MIKSSTESKKHVRKIGEIKGSKIVKIEVYHYNIIFMLFYDLGKDRDVIFEELIHSSLKSLSYIFKIK